MIEISGNFSNSHTIYKSEYFGFLILAGAIPLCKIMNNYSNVDIDFETPSHYKYSISSHSN